MNTKEIIQSQKKFKDAILQVKELIEKQINQEIEKIDIKKLEKITLKEFREVSLYIVGRLKKHFPTNKLGIYYDVSLPESKTLAEVLNELKEDEKYKVIIQSVCQSNAINFKEDIEIKKKLYFGKEIEYITVYEENNEQQEKSLKQLDIPLYFLDMYLEGYEYTLNSTVKEYSRYLVKWLLVKAVDSIERKNSKIYWENQEEEIKLLHQLIEKFPNELEKYK